VVVSDPAPSSRKTVATISSALMRTAHRRENEASVIAGDLQTEEVHGNLSLRSVQRPLV
jgi:hypothetical protein